jgi:glycosyltransferase involved in cell wall biosynthesis
MHVVHLTDSPFFGGPERQMVGLAVSLPGDIDTSFLCFRDRATCRPFLEQLTRAGVDARMLEHSNPNFLQIVKETRDEIRAKRADLLICHGYKADVLGLFAGRWAGVPVISVSRGWTAHTRKVRLNEGLDRRFLRWMDAVVCVSEGQAEKVRRSGVRSDRVFVIRNAIDSDRFAEPHPESRQILRNMFASARDRIVLAVGRLSPEKGYEQLVETARMVVRNRPDTGFVLIGDGPERGDLAERISRAGLERDFILAGFRSDVDQLLPHADVLVQSSYTEGLPNVILEACAAGLPVVATAVGGTPEVVQDGVTGFLVPSGDPAAMAARLSELFESPDAARAMGERGRSFVRAQFSFANQSAEYRQLLERVLRTG